MQKCINEDYFCMMCCIRVLFCFFLQRRFPDFSYVNKNGPLTDFVDCVIIRLAASYVVF